MTHMEDPWGRLSRLPLFTMLICCPALMGLAFLVDDSGLDQGPESWGYVLGSALILIGLASWPLGLALMTAVGGSPRGGDPMRRRVCAWVGAIAAALSGMVLGAVGVTQMVGGTDAGLAWGLGAVLIAAPLFLPLVLCRRASRRTS